MSKKDLGGPAYPSAIRHEGSEAITGFVGEEIEPGTTSYYPGMTLRDYFAAKANEKDIVDMIHAHFLSEHARNHNEYVPLTRQQARFAHADAMLAERAK